MTDVSKINAASYSEKNGLADKITLADTGIYTIPADLAQTLVLDPLNVSAETFKKIEKGFTELAGGVVYTAGNLAVEHFKANPEAVEIGFNYQQGSMTTVSGLFNRDAKDHTVLAFETKYKTADMKRVLSYLGDEIANINS
ncbi:hypothetical protein MZD04_gp251 [Pseudomonas phage Psa21]|uniref:Uncharacterized protein n=1 Tax=Pseudomonas phage Psa21 TaxID=2530023 RepID=A0A481W6E2_9CAUD|nr:hypothetical protein MZD04_gp251 [Pseudomonas phage Psa21]QBJ02777.1 hypothetical protein PSA21_251 [Pseudomonas phage Psa21]